ncbi:hypothetical protein [Streptomyces sp. ODS05-4]|uniref:hypothetical protein n=1 Tax=Streptomyces sp. ODS05-4 TaxID=2944939 RepID=UPI00210EA079|nr:hypothetical protein [Streptomyces sp. ODS05-4]
MDFELPEDITTLDDEQLSDALAGAIAAFYAGSRAETITAKGPEAMRALSDVGKAIRNEEAARQQAAAEIYALAASVRGDTRTTSRTRPRLRRPPPAEPGPVPKTAPLE